MGRGKKKKPSSAVVMVVDDDGDVFDTGFPSLNKSHSHNLPKKGGSVNLSKTSTMSQFMASPGPTEASDKSNGVVDNQPVFEQFVSLPKENASSLLKNSGVTAVASPEAIMVKLDSISKEINGLRDLQHWKVTT